MEIRRLTEDDLGELGSLYKQFWDEESSLEKIRHVVRLPGSEITGGNLAVHPVIVHTGDQCHTFHRPEQPREFPFCKRCQP